MKSTILMHTSDAKVLLVFPECTSFSPAATTVFLIFLLFESLLFGIFTAIMCGTQLSAICSDETVTKIYNVGILDFPCFSSPDMRFYSMFL